jgi:hypothetical protein
MEGVAMKDNVQKNSSSEEDEQTPHVKHEGKLVPEHEHPAWPLLSAVFCLDEED